MKPRLRDQKHRVNEIYGIGEFPEDVISKIGASIVYLAYNPLIRECVLIRDSDLTEFSIYENYLEHVRISDYEWTENKNNNLEGLNRFTGIKSFVWQPHGSQLTILENIPQSALRFRLKHPAKLDKEECLKAIGFDSSWIEIIA